MMDIPNYKFSKERKINIDWINNYKISLIRHEFLDQVFELLEKYPKITIIF